MRVHRTKCSGHRPLSSPRPMADPAARHRPSPERSGRRLPGALGCASTPRPMGTPRLEGRADVPSRCGAGWPRGGGPTVGGGPRRPRGAAQEAGSWPERVRARGVVCPCARVTHSTSLGSVGETGNSSQQLGRTSSRPEPSLALSFQPLLARACQSTASGSAPGRTWAHFQPPLAALPHGPGVRRSR